MINILRNVQKAAVLNLIEETTCDECPQLLSEAGKLYLHENCTNIVAQLFRIIHHDMETLTCKLH